MTMVFGVLLSVLKVAIVSVATAAVGYGANYIRKKTNIMITESQEKQINNVVLDAVNFAEEKAQDLLKIKNKGDGEMFQVMTSAAKKQLAVDIITTALPKVSKEIADMKIHSVLSMTKMGARKDVDK